MPPAIRGAVLVGLLVIVGIVGLQVLDDSSPGSTDVVVTTTLPGQTTLPAVTTVPPATATTKPATTATTKATASAARGTSATTVKTKKPADIKVVVFNASGVTQMAENMSNQLKAVGYNSSVGGNLSERTGTIVQCKAGLEAEATKLANDGVGKGASVTPYPANPPTNAGDADCIVVLGKAA
jgi:LytR cell envelope-related transcriptional attenuator